MVGRPLSWQETPGVKSARTVWTPEGRSRLCDEDDEACSDFFGGRGTPLIASSVCGERCHREQSGSSLELCGPHMTRTRLHDSPRPRLPPVPPALAARLSPRAPWPSPHTSRSRSTVRAPASGDHELLLEPRPGFSVFQIADSPTGSLTCQPSLTTPLTVRVCPDAAASTSLMHGSRYGLSCTSRKPDTPTHPQTEQPTGTIRRASQLTAFGSWMSPRACCAPALSGSSDGRMPMRCRWNHLIDRGSQPWTTTTRHDRHDQRRKRHCEAAGAAS